MSVSLMGQIWPQTIEPVGKKMVLLAFADAANDDGITWIALESERGKLDMLTKCSISRRTLSVHVAALQADGFVERHETIGKGCIWRVHASPANSARLPSATPANSATPLANSAGEPLTNHQYLENKGEQISPSVEKCPLIGRALPTGVSLDQWEAFLDMRASIAKPVRAYVATKVLATLDGFAKLGWHAGDILDRSTVNAWPDVYVPEEGRVTGVRRVVNGKASHDEGGGVSQLPEADRLEFIRIANIPDRGQMLAERRAFMAAIERRNAPAPFAEIVAELPLRPPVGGRRSE